MRANKSCAVQERLHGRSQPENEPFRRSHIIHIFIKNNSNIHSSTLTFDENVLLNSWDGKYLDILLKLKKKFHLKSKRKNFENI